MCVYVFGYTLGLTAHEPPVRGSKGKVEGGAAKEREVARRGRRNGGGVGEGSSPTPTLDNEIECKGKGRPDVRLLLESLHTHSPYLPFTLFPEDGPFLCPLRPSPLTRFPNPLGGL